MLRVLPSIVKHDTVVPARERYGNPEIPKWMLCSASSGQYTAEATPLWWHPEWRGIIVRGSSQYMSPTFDLPQFPDGRSPIDRIVDMGFVGVNQNNISRADAAQSKWKALLAYNELHPQWYLEP